MTKGMVQEKHLVIIGVTNLKTEKQIISLPTMADLKLDAALNYYCKSKVFGVTSKVKMPNLSIKRDALKRASYVKR